MAKDREIREFQGERLYLLPPLPGLCRQCAVNHPPDQPHDASSLFYGFWFLEAHGRSPTWADAMAHCSEDVKQHWMAYLAGVGIDINSTSVRGGIRSKEELGDRLKRYEEGIDNEISDSD